MRRGRVIYHTQYIPTGVNQEPGIVRIYITKDWWEVYHFCVLKNPYLDSFIWVPMRDIFSAVVKNSEAQCVGSSCQIEGTVVLYNEVWLSGLLLIEIWHCEKQWGLLEALFILHSRRYLNMAPPMFQYWIQIRSSLLCVEKYRDLVRSIADLLFHPFNPQGRECTQSIQKQKQYKLFLGSFT
jgi:hypothetical protein